jgi:hypothetical protein
VSDAHTVAEALARDPAALAAAEAELARALDQRNIFFGDGLLPTCTLAHLVPATQLASWRAQSDELAAAIEELAAEVLAEPALYDELRLRPDARPLLAIDPGYRRITTLARPDAVLDGDRLVFLEVNCDSPAMMSFADAVSDCLLALPAYAPFRARLEPEARTPALLEALLACWREFGGSPTVPTIAISDWPGQMTRFEHREIARVFEAAGVPTLVCDPRAFRRNGRALEADGRPVHLVYRRALFTELLDRQAEVAPLLDAYREGAICMVNSLRSYLASSKTLLPRLGRRLPGQIADTCVVGPAERARLAAPPRGHVLKRAESHGGLAVLLPEIAGEPEWAAAIAESHDAPWVMQTYHPVPRLAIPRVVDGAARLVGKYYNWNPFLFGGRYAGSIARASDTPLINITLGGALLPTVGERR